MLAFSKKIISILAVFVFAFLDGLAAQSPERDTNEANLSFAKRELIPLIESRMKQPGGDTVSHYIIAEIEAHCRGNYECSRSNIVEVLNWLWFQGWFEIGLPIAKEEVRLADLYGTIKNKVDAYESLTVFNWWVGDSQGFYLSMEKMKVVYEKAFMPNKAIETEVAILEGKAWLKDDVDELMPELNRLLEEAIEVGNDMTILEIRSKIMYIAEGHGMYELMEEHLTEIENYLSSVPPTDGESPYAYNVACNRAVLLKVENKYNEAKKYFEKALGIAREGKDLYREIATLQGLAKLEWDRGEVALSKAYLDTAFQYADSLVRHDELSEIYQMKAEIAEKEKQFEDALLFNKKMHFHQEVYDSSSIGFDAKSYYLQMEKDQLATEKKTQELALQLKSSQLNYSIAIVALSVFAAIGLLVGFRNQRRRKEELKTQNATIQKQTKQLKSLDAAKSRFFANVSHELRTPLTLMLGPVKTLLKDNSPPEQRKTLLHMALQSGQQLHQLVNEILDLQKLEMGKMELQEELTELPSFFNQHTAQFESLAANGQIEFSYETSIDAGITAAIDREKFRQILHNLLANAFKFTPAGGSVAARLSLESNILTLEVSDTGTGIHPDDLPHLFDRFFQSSRPDKTAQGGTGIGLALCKEYAQLFGGKMEAESQLGTGSVFRAIFPVILSESTEEVAAIVESADIMQPLVKPEYNLPEKSAVDALSTPPEGEGRASILVVEDNPDLQQYIRLILEEKYRVIMAGNGKEALEVLQSSVSSSQSSVRQSTTHNPFVKQEPKLPIDELRPVDLILSDLMMPVMDGYQLLEKLKSDDATRHIPFIMLTARVEAKDRLKALRIGVDDYLTKPFDEEELLVRIENLLTNKAVRENATIDIEEAAEVSEISQPDQNWLEKFESYVKDNLANNALTISFLAQEFAMSESTLFRQVTRLTGLSPKQYLQEVRLDAARQLLENRVYRSISKVATEVGYTNSRTFTRNFRERYGKMPSEYLSA